jgi:hypothetical protein
MIKAHATIASLGFKQIKLGIVAVHIFEYLLHGWILPVGEEAGGDFVGRKERRTSLCLFFHLLFRGH